MRNLNDLGEKGMSMVQVMIASAMVGGLALVITQLNQQQLKVRKSAEVNNDLTMIESRIQGVINKKEICTNTFAEAKPGTLLTGIKLSEEGNQWFIKAGQAFTGTKVIVTDLRILTRDEEEEFGRWKNNGGEPMWSSDGTSTIYLKIDFAIGRLDENGVIIKDKNTFKASRFHKIFSIPVKIADLIPQYGCKDPDTNPITDAMEKCRDMVGTGEYKNGSYGSGTQPAGSNWQVNNSDTIAKNVPVPECGGGPNGHMHFCEIKHIDGQVKECLL